MSNEVIRTPLKALNDNPPDVAPPSHFDKSYGYSKHHKDYHPDGLGRPGYFQCEQYLVRRQEKGGEFERWDTEKKAWEIVPDEVYIRQNAQRLTTEEAEKLAHKHGVTEPLAAFE